MRQRFVYWWYSGTKGQPYAYNRKSLSAARFPQIGSILVLSVFLLMSHSREYRLESVVSPVLMPTIYLGEDPSQPTPCGCLNNSTTPSNGQFSTLLSIEAPTGQIWTITESEGLFAASSPDPPASPTPILVGTIIPEVSDGLYQLAVRHIEDIGFLVVANNGIDPDLKATATCSYPNPEFVNLADQYCITSLPITLEADVAGAAGSGTFQINDVDGDTFDPFDLGVGTHEVTYTFDAGEATSGDPTDPGCSYTISKKIEVLGIPSLGANLRVQIPLGLDCSSVIVPDMILEGTYPCIDTDYVVNIINGDGVPIGNTVTEEHAGQILMVSVSTIRGGFSTMGSIEVVDNTAPIANCTDDLRQVAVQRSVQFLEGDLADSDPTFIPANFSCFLDQLESTGGFHYFDIDTLRPVDSDVYTFEFMADFGAGAGGLYLGKFNTFDGPCQGYAALGSPLSEDSRYFVSEDGVIGFSTYLEAGKLYTLLTTSANPMIEGDYSWAIYGAEGGQLENLLSSEEELYFPLYCEDYLSILDNAESLNYTGAPEASDNCSAVSFSFADELIENGDCGETLINRQFTVMDENGNSTTCGQNIFFSPLTHDDIIPPSKFFTLQCDEGFDVNDEGNPTPDYIGFPMIKTFSGAFRLDPDFCNLTATYDDQMAMTNCGGSRVFNRRWFFYDQCNPANPVFFDQVIFIEDNTPPTVEVNLEDLPYETSALHCEATLEIPLPVVTDNCSDWQVLTEVIATDGSGDVLATIPNDGDREVTIPLGCHTLRYNVMDDCGNINIANFTLCTTDDQEPVAVCDDNLIVSLGGSGLGFLDAIDVDEGSEDNCGIASMEIRRNYTTDPSTCDSIEAFRTEWGEQIEFTCCDAGKMVMVELQVTDIFGNDNRCMTFISVTDKADPDCTAPDDVDVNCTLLPPGFDPTDTLQLMDLFGSAEGEDNCSSFTIAEKMPMVNLDDCGAGTIERLFEVTDEFGNISLDECKQTITIAASPGYRIKFPKDIFQECSDPIVDTLEIIREGCESLVVSFKDEVFQTSEACRKIFRTYRIEDQCIHTDSSDPVVIGRNEDCDNEEGEEAVWLLIENDTAFVDRDQDRNNNTPSANQIGSDCSGQNPAGYWRTLPSTGYWEYTQEILIFDLTAPVITPSTDSLFCGDNADNCTGFVDYPFSVTEGCSPEGTTIRAWIDNGNDGSLDDEISPENILGIFPSFRITGRFPLGVHAFQIEVTDGCDNRTSLDVSFEVIDCSVTAPTCRQPFSVEIMPQDPVIDADGDGDLDLGAISILATAVLTSNVDDCNGPVSFSIHKTLDLENGTEIPDSNEEAVVLTCDEVDESVEVQVYAWDNANNPLAIQPDGTIGGPNYSFCTTTITLLDSEGVCNPSPLAAISGEIMTAEDEPVQGVMMQVREDMPMYGPTNINGSYTMDNLSVDSNYQIRPEMDYDFSNGISTIDLILISKHILGEQRLASPYKIIAADVNRSSNVTTFDIILLRQLILGIHTSIPQNTSWRFVDAAYQFPKPENPWSETFPEVIQIENLQDHREHVDFIAIKIGDINGNAYLNELDNPRPRNTAGTFFLELEDQTVKAGQVIHVQLSSSQLEQIVGFQGSLRFDPGALQLEDFQAGLLESKGVNLGLTGTGILPISWDNTHINTQSAEDLFSLTFRCLQDGKLSEWMKMSDRITPREAYQRGGAWQDVELGFHPAGKDEEIGDFKLLQNRPNPFSQKTAIGFHLPEAGKASLRIFDMSGRLLKEYQNHFERGYNEIEVDASDLTTQGLLYYQLSSKTYSATRKMILSKGH